MQEIILLAFIMALAMGAYWSMVIFPKQRDFQKRQRIVRNLVEGDEVITAGGIIGRIIGLEAEQGIAYVEIADGVVVRMVSASILSTFDPDELAKNARIGLETDQEKIPQ
ncbi:MAG: preprotein translocase subunit YajC [Anaerolineae bacterium]|nr:preprotein translocase subunit YajC [Anaerolineae bacterium]